MFHIIFKKYLSDSFLKLKILGKDDCSRTEEEVFAQMVLEVKIWENREA